MFGDSKRPLVKEDLLKLKYLERVVKESLRLFPPVPFIIRKIDKEIELRKSPYSILFIVYHSCLLNLIFHNL